MIPLQLPISCSTPKKASCFFECQIGSIVLALYKYWVINACMAKLPTDIYLMCRTWSASDWHIVISAVISQAFFCQNCLIYGLCQQLVFNCSLENLCIHKGSLYSQRLPSPSRRNPEKQMPTKRWRLWCMVMLAGMQKSWGSILLAWITESYSSLEQVNYDSNARRSSENLEAENSLVAVFCHPSAICWLFAA